MPLRSADRTATPASVGEGSRAYRVAVVGGGITGLASAWYLERQAASQGLSLRVTVLEAAGRWGGKISTERVDGFGASPFVVEAGPDSFLTQKPWALDLAHELGLDERLLDTNDAQRRVFVVKKGRPVLLPDGVLLIIPTRFTPFITSPLISWPGKLRMGLDLFIPPRADGQDETVADFVRRRLGAEAVDRLAEPLMSGIYNAEADRQSVLATFPRFREIEARHGSLIWGMLTARRARRQTPPSRRAMFVSLHAGTQELVDTLVEKLGADLRLNAPVTGLECDTNGYNLTLAGGETVSADAVILTSPAYAAAGLLRGPAPEAARQLSAIRYVSTGTLSLAYRQDEIGHPLDGFGLVIPVSEGRRINAVTWTSTKFSHRAPEGYALLRVFFGGSRRPEMMERPDEDVLRIAREELASLMGVTAEPVFHRLARWHEANPQYDVGHLSRVDAIEAALPPGLHVAGSAYRGIGIPDCVHQAQCVAAKVTSHMKEQHST